MTSLSVLRVLRRSEVRRSWPRKPSGQVPSGRQVPTDRDCREGCRVQQVSDSSDQPPRETLPRDFDEPHARAVARCPEIEGVGDGILHRSDSTARTEKVSWCNFSAFVFIDMRLEASLGFG